MLISLDQKVRSRLLLSTLGAHGQPGLPGESWGLTHRIKQAEHGKPVSLPRQRQADRKEG
jgi:hypothetical protein